MFLEEHSEEDLDDWSFRKNPEMFQEERGDG